MRPVILRGNAQGAQARDRLVEPPLSGPARTPARTPAANAAGRQGRTRRRDPAPSRVAYKLHRLWLTPAFRLFLRAGLPMLVTFVLAYAWLAEPERRQVLLSGVSDLTRALKSRPEFMITLMAIEGASPDVAAEIRAEFPLEMPVSSFDLDLEMMQAEIADLDAVEKAELRLRPGGVLEISVTERVPVVVWRSRDGLFLLDLKGNRVADLDQRAARGDLPLIAGEGAGDKVAEALSILRAAQPLARDLRGLVRVGERRWDVVLTGGRTIKLPESYPVAALQQVIALDQAQDLLARAVAVVDMRTPSRPTLRLAPVARAELRRIRAYQSGDFQ